MRIDCFGILAAAWSTRRPTPSYLSGFIGLHFLSNHSLFAEKNWYIFRNPVKVTWKKKKCLSHSPLGSSSRSAFQKIHICSPPALPSDWDRGRASFPLSLSIFTFLDSSFLSVRISVPRFPSAVHLLSACAPFSLSRGILQRLKSLFWGNPSDEGMFSIRMGVKLAVD